MVFSCNCDAGYANFSLQINMFQFPVANDGWIRFLMKEGIVVAYCFAVKVVVDAYL